jgi:hypothetical protein
VLYYSSAMCWVKQTGAHGLEKSNLLAACRFGISADRQCDFGDARLRYVFTRIV